MRTVYNLNFCLFILLTEFEFILYAISSIISINSFLISIYVC